MRKNVWAVAALVAATVGGLSACGAAETRTTVSLRTPWLPCRTLPAAAPLRTADPLDPHSGLSAAERATGRVVLHRLTRILTPRQARIDRLPPERRPVTGGLAPHQIGNGVLLDDGDVLTANHVVQGHGPVVLEIDGAFRPGTVTASNLAADLAVVHPSRPFPASRPPTHLPIGPIPPGVGPAITWTSFESPAPRRQPQVHRIRTLGPDTLRWRDITTADRAHAVHDAALACGGALIRGASGSPVVSDTGHLIGIAVAAGGAPADVDGTLLAPAVNAPGLTP